MENKIYIVISCYNNFEVTNDVEVEGAFTDKYKACCRIKDVHDNFKDDLNIINSRPYKDLSEYLYMADEEDAPDESLEIYIVEQELK